MALKKAILKFAKEEFEKREDSKLVAPISPSPSELIQGTLDQLDLLAAASKLTYEQEQKCDESKKSGSENAVAWPGSGLQQQRCVVDLGCGDGRWLVACAARWRCPCVGIDLNAGLLEAARAKVQEAQLQDYVELMEGDIFDADISRATSVILYLFREGVARMKEKLEAELASGTEVVAVG
mmetsp:Transcript_28829/g.37890  ORF Transcript_28829/g.37890 Transcript_28829/m.37890 type:complete len:181 (+) Transcript_28829:65-607(+)|eukprot:CAMPEP_0117754922 /NCGR_PEP_ID=MMETSP0947-20121206/13139_1 /TAXON_ID=44440 /ORGANISM="Chattonella subsalsa, Strain CCMP2191" /LENGTH=180 /DNA_ID=CAMNT_0005574147 /DNA_START=60 /DNA_END=602 /DNA_ORIENTATION=-